MADFPGIPLEGDESPGAFDVAGLVQLDVPLVQATPVSLAGYGVLGPAGDADAFPVELVPWPALGWRPVDPGMGLGGGLTSSPLDVRREGDLLVAADDGADSVIGRCAPAVGAEPEPAGPPGVILARASCQLDSGRLIVPVDSGAYVVVLARPGDDVEPGDFVGFLIEPPQALYVPPGVWCGADAAFPVQGGGRFLVRRGRIRARISCDFQEEFGVVLSVPLHLPIP